MAPAVEYNLFRYSESTRRQLRFLYKVGYDNVRYDHETIYDKTSETLFGEALSITLARSIAMWSIHVSGIKDIACKEIRQMDSKAANWIAADVLQELASEKVKKRLQSKKAL